MTNVEMKMGPVKILYSQERSIFPGEENLRSTKILARPPTADTMPASNFRRPAHSKTLPPILKMRIL